MTIGTWQEGQQSGPRSVLGAERAWAILLAIREHTRRFGRSEGDLSVLLRQDGQDLRVHPGRAREAVLCCGADGAWETPAPPDRGAALPFDLYMPLCR